MGALVPVQTARAPARSSLGSNGTFSTGSLRTGTKGSTQAAAEVEFIPIFSSVSSPEVEFIPIFFHHLSRLTAPHLSKVSSRPRPHRRRSPASSRHRHHIVPWF